MSAYRVEKRTRYDGSTYLRAVWTDRSKYQPHQGKRERERRVNQMAGMTHGYGWAEYAALGFPRNALVAE